MTRRMQHYDNLSWQPWLQLAAVGSLVILIGIVCQVVQLVVSIRNRDTLRDVTGDPWDGRTLEWSTASPPPPWNYAFLPHISERDMHWHRKLYGQALQAQPALDYEPIEVPNNTATGFVTAFFAVVTGFALIWHIWWMAALGIFGAFVTMLIFAFRDREEVEIPAKEVAEFDRTHPAEAVL